MNILFLHPDLGIGGAERAVIDAALALKRKGHSVHFVTAHHDPKHCFDETRDGTLEVTAVGDWLPRSICGFCYAACAYIRMIYAATYVVFFSSLKFDVVFVDQISACIPFLRRSKSKILFYCHFPDMLLTKRESFLKKLYRKPLDWLEEKTTGMADCILVNSKYTAGVFLETFTSLSDILPKVLYPVPNFAALSQPADVPTDDLIPKDKKYVFLSINRYERKKGLILALDALAQLNKRVSNIQDIHVVIAGGYDKRVVENKEYYDELKKRADTLGVANQVTFLRSFSDSQKRTLLQHCTCLLYTPEYEHFGIVPVEAMYLRCPVIACNSGGPLETIDDGVTGFLVEPTPYKFAQAMEKFVKYEKLRDELGTEGRKRVEKHFSSDTFANQLDKIVTDLVV